MPPLENAPTPPSSHSRSILLINPNTTQSMTDGLKPLVDSLNYTDTHFTYLTAPTGPASINNELDGQLSATACLPTLKTLIPHHDAFIVCCYSAHPLVPALRSELKALGLDSRKLVAGIFESSVTACLQMLDSDEKFGIVSTGQQWEAILGDAVATFLGSRESGRYAGTETTGLNADELHSTPREEVDRRMNEATKRLLGRGARAVCLGCAGMAGLDSVVRRACVEALGEVEGGRVRVVDGVVSAVVAVEGALRVLGR